MQTDMPGRRPPANTNPRTFSDDTSSSSDDEDVLAKCSKDKENKLSVEELMKELEYEERPGQRLFPNPGIKINFSNLPPSLKEEEFREIVGELPPHNYFFYRPPFKMGNIPPTCNAIINFDNRHDAGEMMRRLNGMPIMGANEMEYYVIPYVMPNQWMPKLINSPNPLEGTYEQSEKFKAFAAKWEASDDIVSGHVLNPDGEITTDLMLQEIEDRKAKAKQLQDTPLLEYLRTKGEASREKAKLRLESIAKEKQARERRQLKMEEMEKREKEKKERRKKEKAKKREKERIAVENARKEKKTRQLEVQKGLNTETSEARERTSSTGDAPKPHAEEAKKDTKDSNLKTEPSQGTSKRDKDLKSDGRNVKSYKGSSKQWERETYSKREDKWERREGDGRRKYEDRRKPDSNSKPGEGKKLEAKSVVTEEGGSGKAANPDSAGVEATPSNPSPGDVKKEPKKKIVKKIIRVRKVKNGEVVEEVPSTSSSSTRIITSTKKSGGAGEEGGANEKSEPQRDSVQPNGEKKEEKRKRNRPDIQIYRPGNWRRNPGNATTGSGQKDKELTKEKPEASNPRTATVAQSSPADA